MKLFACGWRYMAVKVSGKGKLLIKITEVRFTQVELIMIDDFMCAQFCRLLTALFNNMRTLLDQPLRLSLP